MPYDPTDNFLTDFARFLTEGIRNRYVADEFGVCQVYMRKSRRLINGTMTPTLDIANINIDEDYRNKGIGVSIIEMMHKHNPFRVTYIENLLNDRLHQRLVKDGWESLDDAYPPCLIKTTAK